jgi:phage-related tail protein
VATLSNEVLKLNSLYEQSNDTVTELNSSIQSTQIRLDCQINLKVQLQEKCERLNAEVISLSKSLSREKESLRSMNTEKENLRR